MYCNLFMFQLILIVCLLKVSVQPLELPDKISNFFKNLATEARNLAKRGISKEDINFELYTNQNPMEFIRLDPDNLEVFRGQTNKIVFLIHGYVSSSRAKQVQNLKDAFLMKYPDSFVISLGWEEGAEKLYHISVSNIEDVALEIVKVILTLYGEYGIDKNNFLLVGHSLGAQMCGYIGQYFAEVTNEKLPRIIALDPAGPLFRYRSESERLSPDDAEVVKVIHTDAGALGFSDSCGTIDFFVNGGRRQPGCRKIDINSIINISNSPLACDHTRVWDYFLEALLIPQSFPARKCPNKKYNRASCTGEIAYMSDLDLNQTGDFYVQTNAKTRYSKDISRWT